MSDLLGMYITNVEKEGVFLKFWGQTDKKAALDVELALFKAYVMYEQGQHVLSPSNLQIGVLCCAKYIDDKYYRARITNNDSRCQGTVEVNFIDFGNRDMVPIANLRSIDCFNATFITLPPLALPFILSEVICLGGEWNEVTLDHISRQVRYMEVHYTVVSTHLGYTIIKIFVDNKDLALHLVGNKLMQSVSLENQESLLNEMIPRAAQVMPPPDQSLLQYKSVTLEPNTRHEVYVSYITDGPCHFSVQLKKSEGILAQLMREINSIPLKPFEELPIPGTVCLAKCIEDSHICRAVITSEVDNQYKLFYVDFGNTEIVPSDNIYQMPFKYIIPKIMAIRLSLEGFDKSTVTLEMQCAFKQFVDNRLLMMEVFPSAKKMCLPKCRMWDPETNTDVADILNKAAQLAFPNVISLHRGFTRPVKVTFVYSCNKFFIHLMNNGDELNHLMADLQIYCNSEGAFSLTEPKVGLPCCAQFSFDGQWYRSLIVSLNNNSAKVKYIDYGNEEDVPVQSLKTIEGKFLTMMRPQAIECCLNGYQNMTEDLNRDNKLEELILDQEFTMKVIDIVNNKCLVELIDKNGGNVTSLLMEAMVNETKVQVVGNEKNGRSPDKESWSPRDKSQNRLEKSESWRQSSRKQNGCVSNDNTDSWRHRKDSKGPEWHDNSSNDSFSKGKRNKENRRSPSVKSQNISSSEQDKSFSNQNSSIDSQENGCNNHERSSNRTPSFRKENSGYSNKENNLNRNKPRNFNDNWNSDNSPKTFEDSGEYQGVKRKPRNVGSYNENRNSNRNDNGDWGNKKNTNNGNDYSERKSNRDRNSHDGDSSYQKGNRDGSFDNKNRYNDRRNQNRKFPRRDNEFHASDHEQTDGKKFNSNHSKWTDKNDTYGNSHKKAAPKIDAAPDNATFSTTEVTGRQKVTLSWFHNPCSFFCQLLESQQSFSKLMEDIQEFYKNQADICCVEGAPAIALFPEDNVFYRSRILKVVGSQYKVYYVDFGNISVVDKVWPIDVKFMELPMQAVPCGLGGIQAVGSEWPDPISFTDYMQKDCLDCEFLSYEIDRYVVNLYSDNQDIKQQLIRDNLVRCIEPFVPPATGFEMSYLFGHTFRAMLDLVNDLSDFTMSLSTGVQLRCSAHNLADAAERFDEVLKQQEGQVLVVYCDNIVENRLEVTLYDHVGTKLTILNPDEGAYETVEPVCPYLLLQPTVTGFVSAVNEGSVVVQPSECAQRLDGLLNQIYEHYANLPEEAPLIPEEGFLYAVRSHDSNWYRGRVVSFDDEKVTVLYVDYGNTEDVAFSSLKELDQKFYWWDRMAILVNVNVPTTELLEKQVTLQVVYGDSGLEGEVLEVVDNVQEVPQTSEIDNIDAQLETVCQITEDAQNQPQSDRVDTVAITPVILIHVDSPNDFYIQLVDSQYAISELQTKLQEKIEDMPVLENVSIGGLCAAPYSVDQMWYRSQILDADEDITTVRFIDYGNTDVIDNKSTRVKTLPSEFLALEEYATRCRLKIKPVDGDWSKAASDRFEEFARREDVCVQFVNQDEKTNYVELFSGGRNVKDVLIAENLAVVDEEVVLEERLKGYISHMNSPSEFWVQLDGWCADLEWIAEQLSSAAGFPDLEDLTPGSLCAAMFPDDEMWYRARILSNTVAGLEVLFLDYGNSCVCTSLKQLPEHLVMASPLAFKCSLRKPEGVSCWSQNAAQRFADLSADGRTEFTVKKVTTGETSTVELYVVDRPVSESIAKSYDGFLDCKIIGESNDEHEESLDTCEKVPEIIEIPYSKETCMETIEIIQEESVEMKDVQEDSITEEEDTQELSLEGKAVEIEVEYTITVRDLEVEDIQNVSAKENDLKIGDALTVKDVEVEDMQEVSTKEKYLITGKDLELKDMEKESLEENDLEIKDALTVKDVEVEDMQEVSTKEEYSIIEKDSEVKDIQEVSTKEEDFKIEDVQDYAIAEKDLEVKNIQKVSTKEEDFKIEDVQECAIAGKELKVKDILEVPTEEKDFKIEDVQECAIAEKELEVKDIQEVSTKEEDFKMEDVQDYAIAEKDLEVKDIQEISTTEKDFKIEDVQDYAIAEKELEVKDIQEISTTEKDFKIEDVQECAIAEKDMEDVQKISTKEDFESINDEKEVSVENTKIVTKICNMLLSETFDKLTIQKETSENIILKEINEDDPKLESESIKEVSDTCKNEKVDVIPKKDCCEVSQEEEKCDDVNEETAKVCDISNTVAVVCDKPEEKGNIHDLSKDIDVNIPEQEDTQEIPLDEQKVPEKSEELKSRKTTTKVEFKEKIMTCFLAPKVSKNEVAPKISPTKVTIPKLQESVEKNTELQE